ncbi:hypothetical protein SDC9_155247 [bioreactor metagenome]|uniref:Uncharacterized protein n=1 Tax=bioreactor metagenome TaxID=1076179 RepID=A0A645F116_9ZZZZ
MNLVHNTFISFSFLALSSSTLLLLSISNALYPAFEIACFISESLVAFGLYFIFAFSDAKLTETLSMPSSLDTALSIAFAHAAHVIPDIGTAMIFVSASSTASYPALFTASFILSASSLLSSYWTTIFSVAKFTFASTTPSSLLTALSEALAHAAHVIPIIFKDSVFIVFSFHRFTLHYRVAPYPIFI